MISAISPHDKRVVIIGVAVLLTIIGGSRIAARVTEWSMRTRASAASLVADVAKQEASIRRLPQTRDSLIARRVRLATMDSAILGGETPALAAASLAELVSDVAEATKTQVGNVQVRADSSTRGPFVAVQVQASVTGDLAAVGRFLTKLESGSKLVTVREMGISVQGEQSTAASKRELLRTDLVIEGLARNLTHQGTKP